MQSVDTQGLKALEDMFSDALKKWPKIKGAVLSGVGSSMRGTVVGNAVSSGMKNGGGDIPGWQKYYVGSGLGYVAVRAIGSEDGGGTGSDSEGAITNYTEHGHKIRKPKAEKKKGYYYRDRRKVLAVRGFHYYHRSQDPARQAAAQAANDLTAQASALLGGG